MPSKDKGSGFIADIEALRGVAVIAVIINHFNENFLPSGFLGVDLFFVISGFVVTKSLYRIQTLDFRRYLFIFYTKRLKRIYPALFIFVVITFICLAITDQNSVKTWRTGALSLIGMSNLYLMLSGNDYFGLNPEFNLFTHTWSLGIEEQFYLFLPIFLFVSSKNWAIRIGASIALIAISATSYIYAANENIFFQYYSPITRFWELMLGSVTYQIYEKKLFRYNSSLNYILLLMIFLCFIVNKEYIVITTPVLCLLSAFLIYSLSSSSKYSFEGGAKRNILLSNRHLIYVGSISYSLYLYHFPIIKLMNLPGYWSIIQFVILFVVACASFEWIEKPFRYNLLENISERKNLYSFSVVAVTSSFLLVLYSYVLNQTKTGPFQLPNNDILAQYDSTSIEDFDQTGEKKGVLVSEGRPSLFFVGDSHSNSLTPLMVHLHEIDRYQIFSLDVIGPSFTSLDARHHGNVIRISDNSRKLLTFIQEKGKQGDVLILTSQLMTWLSNTYNDEHEHMGLVYNDKVIDQERALFIYANDLENLANILKEKEIEIIITAPFPDWKEHPVKGYSPILTMLKLPNYIIKTSRIEQEERRGEIVNALINLENKLTNFHVFDPINIFCDDRHCYPYKNGMSLYFDDDHVNYNAMPYIYREVLDIISPL